MLVSLDSISKWLPPWFTSCTQCPTIIQLSPFCPMAGNPTGDLCCSTSLLTRFNIWWDYFCSLALRCYCTSAENLPVLNWESRSQICFLCILRLAYFICDKWKLKALLYLKETECGSEREKTNFSCNLSVMWMDSTVICCCTSLQHHTERARSTWENILNCMLSSCSSLLLCNKGTLLQVMLQAQVSGWAIGGRA